MYAFVAGVYQRKTCNGTGALPQNRQSPGLY